MPWAITLSGEKDCLIMLLFIAIRKATQSCFSLVEGQEHRVNVWSFTHTFEKQERKSEVNWKCSNRLIATSWQGLKSLDTIRSQVEH